MSFFQNEAFDDHESIHQFFDKTTELRAVIAIHSTALGPAAGGCRRWQYANDELAIRDALRLSKGMTYKNAFAGIPFGGGKCVLLARPNQEKTPKLFETLGEAIDSLGGKYVTAEDVGVSTKDMENVKKKTKFVSGLPQDRASAGGDPSPWTALGVALSLKEAAKRRLGVDSLQDVTVAVQGVGHVGFHLCQLLSEAGANLIVADVNKAGVDRVVEQFRATAVAPDQILVQEADVLAPCALGAILNSRTIPKLKVKVIAGAANNQLEADEDAQLLAERAILFAPDYVINSGGIISVAREYLGGYTYQQLSDEIHQIPERLKAVFDQAERANSSTKAVADEMTEAIFKINDSCFRISAKSA